MHSEPLLLPARAEDESFLPLKKISAGVIENYRHALMQLMAYESRCKKEFRIVPLHRISTTLLTRKQRYWRKFFEGFSQYLYHNKGYTDSLVANIFKIIKSIFNWLKIDKAVPVGDFHKMFRIPVKQPVPFVLMPDQLHFLIYDVDFHEAITPALRRTKNLFVFGCATGLRVSDLMALKQKHVQVRAGITYLNYYTHKTDTHVLIPLPDYCCAIIKRYKGLCKGYLLPRLSNTNFNIQVKELGKAAGWTSVLPKYQMRKGKLVEVKNENGTSWKMYQHITCHTMRRTAITCMLMMGVEEAVVRRMSGHATGSKEFYRYVVLAQTYMDQQIFRAQQRLANDPTWYQIKHKG